MKKALPLIFLIATLFSTNAISQNLLNSRHSSFYTYIYKVDNKEAETIYRRLNSGRKLNSDYSCFHTLVDSFPTDSVFNKKLLPGHYLKTHTYQDQLVSEITTVQPFNIEILNNNSDLQIKIYDTTGNVITNADIEIKNRVVPYDAKSHSYLLRKTNKRGFVKVTYQDLSSYYYLNRSYNNSRFKRINRTIFYQTPIKYTWIPVNMILHIPVDGFRSIQYGHADGYIYAIKKFAIKTYESVACIFDDYYCNEKEDSYKFTRKHQGFVVFNKPKYLPGDTVKFKAFITRKGRPVKEEADVYLDISWDKKIKLAELQPYRPGGYTYEFVLADSLDLQLDRTYSIELYKKPYKKYIEETFYYEDYELGKNKLSVRTQGEKQFKGLRFPIYITGKDENQLNLQDARFEITLLAKKVNSFLKANVFVPDTLFSYKSTLRASGETEVILPDSVMPAANLDYDLQISMLTSDNEKINEHKNISFFHFLADVDFNLKNDSITFTYKINGKEAPKEATICGEDKFGNEVDRQIIFLPATVKINPYYQNYKIETDSLQQIISLSSKGAMIDCFTERNPDSLYIDIQNPRNIPFNYFIYRANHEIDHGYGKTLNYRLQTNNVDNYSVSLQYLWAGQVVTNDYKIPFNEKKLKIEVEQPKLIFPGQKTTINILVKDQNDKPVPNVDLTAYSVTKKFDYEMPVIPAFAKSKKERSVINQFWIKKDWKTDFSQKLPFDSWKEIAGLDSVEYYQFLYPGDKLYLFYYPSRKGITQFSPFVVENGEFIPAHVIYLDRIPVYFSWNTTHQPYSFHTTSGYHQVKLRTSTKLITIDSVLMQAGQKVVISIGDNCTSKNIRVEDIKNCLSESEQRNLYKYIFPYRDDFGERFSYLQQGENIIFLRAAPMADYYSHWNYSPQSTHIAGPVYPRNLNFVMIDSFQTNFNHEPYFEYEFSPGLLKMRSIEVEKLYPKCFLNQAPAMEISDEVFEENDLKTQWQAFLDFKRRNSYHYWNPYSTTNGNGKMIIDWKGAPEDSLQLLNTLLFKLDDAGFLRVYAGNTMLFHDVPPGFYRIVSLFENKEYAVVDSLEVKKDGWNYVEVAKPPIMQKDTFSIRINKLMEKQLLNGRIGRSDFDEKKKLFNLYQQQFVFTGVGDLTRGYVFDEAGEPLPGVNVTVKGTTFGTITNLDGFYSIKAPSGSSLIFSFVGYVQQEAKANGNVRLDIKLVADVCNLQEVVVVGYGVQKKFDLTASVASVNYNLQGKVAGVKIRGLNTLQAGAQPLIVIDGVPYLGKYEDLDPSLIENIEVVKDKAATAIYGARAANGVMLITTKEGTSLNADKGVLFDDNFLAMASKAGAIRNNFSDYAYWQPTLCTDNAGRASFDVTFPDDVTSWRTFVLAINDKKQTGKAESEIKSFKPLMAQENLPRFMNAGDTCLAIGKSLNYTADTIQIETHLEVNGKEIFKKQQRCVNSIIDTLAITATTKDSVEVKYYLTKSDGYFDGELKNIPVFPVGIQKSAGNFYVLENDTTLNFTTRFPDSLGTVTLYAKADVIDVFKDELSQVIHYQYDCNEQMASKLKALLAEQKIAEAKQQKWSDHAKIKRLIKNLANNQNEEGLWGWWNKSFTTNWISIQILEALTEAMKQGYSVDANFNLTLNNIGWKLQSPATAGEKVQLLWMCNLLGNTEIDYQHYFEQINAKDLCLSEKYRLLYIKQDLKIDFNIDEVLKEKKETLFGNYYFEDESNPFSLYNNGSEATLLAYKILKNDSSISDNYLQKIRNYFLEKRGSATFRNTYEKVRIVEAILPDLLQQVKGDAMPSLEISGDTRLQISTFPATFSFSPSHQISIKKTGLYPVYLTTYQQYWDNHPTLNMKDFTITSEFENTGQYLSAGKSTRILVTLNAKKDADYLMIEVPVPAGCSYENKSVKSAFEIHREYLKNKVSIFCTKLNKGKYQFEVDILPRYAGTYTMNPAKVELMYFPTFSANNEVKKVVVK